jgi:hypothetical protein
VPPGPEQVSPEIEQSVVVQHSLFGMHWLLAAHGFWPTGHSHKLPGVGHVSPMILQSLVVQQALSGMQMAAEGHAVLLGGQLSTHFPFMQALSVGHGMPHPPQLFGSVLVFVQYGPAGPPSSVVPPAPSLAASLAAPPSVAPGVH